MAPVVGERSADRRRAMGTAVAVVLLALGVTAVLAQSGALADADARPPAAGLMLAGLSAGTAALAFSRFGTRLLSLPLGVLVGAQSFRIVVELWLAAAHGAGAVPVEMTFRGHNFDIVTGVLALALGLWAMRRRLPRGVVLAWNVLGLALLAVVVATAGASAFGFVATTPRLTLPVTWPGVWLPAWLVQLALLGHLLVFRALARRRTAPRGDRAPAASHAAGAEAEEDLDRDGRAAVERTQRLGHAVGRRLAPRASRRGRPRGPTSTPAPRPSAPMR